MGKLHESKVHSEFCMTLQDKFYALAVEASEPKSIEMKWDTVKSIYIKVVEEKLGFMKKPKERWISYTTWKLIDEHKVLKQTLLTTVTQRAQLASQLLCKEKDKEIKKSARRDKRLSFENKATLAEEAAR